MKLKKASSYGRRASAVLLGRKECAAGSVADAEATRAITFQDDSVIKEARPIAYEMTVHSRPPAAKKDLRYSTFRDYEKEI